MLVGSLDDVDDVVKTAPWGTEQRCPWWTRPCLPNWGSIKQD
jgi:hypothetical protein